VDKSILEEVHVEPMKKYLPKMYSMKKVLVFTLTAILFIECSSIKKENAQLDDLVSVEEMKQDVDYTYRKLQQLHPNLYGYIDKSILDYKFDSLKTTITSPLKPLGFYKKLSPLVAAVRQGHSLVYAPAKQFTKKESKALTKKGTGPISQFDLDVVDEKLYVIKNKSYDKSIQAGTEIISLDSINPSLLIREYDEFFSSDGYNTTYKKAVASRKIVSYFTSEKGIKDSIEYQFKINDSIKVITISRKAPEKPKQDSLKQKSPEIKRILPQIQKDSLKAIKRKKRINGYNKDAQNYTRNFNYVAKDCSVALMKIRGFKNKSFKTFYKESFQQLKDSKTETLILDLRSNGGGRLAEIVDLYSCLTDSSFVFLDETEVVSRASFLRGSYFDSSSLPEKIIKVVFAPLAYTYGLLAVHKSSDGEFYTQSYTKLQKPKAIAFSGKLYVLINGGSFSASSIISSNLKGSKRATFVGQETGGAYNGTVAGFMPEIKLPNSQLKVRIGVMNIVPHFKTNILGHGIYPNYEITPTLLDKITGKDPELEWILRDIKNALPQQ
jgi:C-terminal processing protease CtpA/Prc